MLEEFLEKLVETIKRNDAPNAELLKKHNITLGMRDEQGAGIPVGITTKGCVTGYEKEYSSIIDEEEQVTIKKPHVADPSKIFFEVYGRTPDAKELENFKPKVRSILPFKLKPREGKLQYCGINIQDIVDANQNNFGFEETAYLLLTSELPKTEELEQFKQHLTERRILDKQYRTALIHDYASDNIMVTMSMAILKLHDFDPEHKSTDEKQVLRHCLDIIAKFPTILAYAYHASQDREGADYTITKPSNLPYAEDFLRMLKGEGKYTREEALLLDKYLMLHAEHGGGNNSTFTTRVVTSSGTNTYSTISSALASLEGHKHGGANEDVMKMMKDIKKNVKDWKDNEEVKEYLRKIIRKQAGNGTGLIYGVGHAVYTLSDPRAGILKKYARGLAQQKGRTDEFELVDLVGQLAPKVFAEEKGNGKTISPNVDFYSGFVLDCIGIDQKLYTPLFAMARTAGWTAHRLEQLRQNRIIRPAYIEQIPDKPYINMEER